jgi:parallel beta helix pectate lyase-like protein
VISPTIRGFAAGAASVALLVLALWGGVYVAGRLAHHSAPRAATASPSISASPEPSPSPQTGTSVPASASCPAGQQVANESDLTQALSSAVPGAVIILAPGNYVGQFIATASGTATAPITLCGSSDAIIDGGDIKTGYAFYLNGASWWQLLGFTVKGGQKGVVTDHASHVLIKGLYVHDVGDEGIHLRSFSSDNIIEEVKVRNTGLLTAKFGEGIYVGTANKNWCKYTACSPDQSDRNVVKNNDIANTTAENIDIKEGTTSGVIQGNQLDGVGMVASAATAWVNVKGNGWTVVGNTGQHSIKDGFQVHQVYKGWGVGNIFRSNHAVVDGPGYGFYVQSASLSTVLACDNTATSAGKGLSNARCGA